MELHVLFQSKEWIHTLKMNGSVTSLCFTKDGTRMYSHGGKCYENYFEKIRKTLYSHCN